MDPYTNEDTFGFELLHQIHKEQLNTKEDVLVLFTHWFLMKNGFKCLGIGDSKEIGPNETPCEILPEGWNQTPESYRVRYMKNEKLFILMAVRSESKLLLNFLRLSDHRVFNLQLCIETVQNLEGANLKELIPTFPTLTELLNSEFIVPIQTSGSNNEASTQTLTEDNNRCDRHRDRDSRDSYDPLRADPLRVRRPDPAGYGRNDLDPFGGNPGGMIFDPFRGPRGQEPGPFPGLGVPGRLPRSSVPPGARFDPFGPPDNAPPFRNLREPDDMFM